MKQQIKEKRKQPIRTCLHQPFEYNFRTLDQYSSQDLVKCIQQIKNDQELSQYVQTKVGIRSAIRKLRANQSNFLALILIYDQSITDILIQASTVFWKYNQQIILAKEEIRTHLQKIMKIERINCVYLFTKKDIELPEDVKQKIQKITEQMNVFRKESVCEIPIILGDELKYQTVKLKVPQEQEIQRKSFQNQKGNSNNQEQNQNTNKQQKNKGEKGNTNQQKNQQKQANKLNNIINNAPLDQ
ncbi:unnamed protein product (macronuclear) [Paramecium tetraurelia]|uniref:Uncharacterized protein n=1 Tax=Paramecium tetraurelia TaxID=5888 RepID=A0CR99_PARTE|nr:uncharacterized protein GSPATT00009631001 [Paramecium tetraurelia]CAK73316.1 unnamed protein product [Paramecium tetraurelia]|eukprot:XP_001440713.1 hypothetical protein (macronuclear) [Paramecium tetraurelia strain d4-2]